MSVINKMLQDLDARQGGTAEASQLYTKPAAAADNGMQVRLVVAAVGVALLAGGTAFGWRYWHKPKQLAPAPVPAKVVLMPPPATVTPLAAAQAPAPVSESASVPAPAPVSASAVVPGPKLAPEPAPVTVAPSPAASARVVQPAQVSSSEAGAAPPTPSAHVTVKVAADKHVTAKKHGKREVKVAGPKPAPAKADQVGAQGKEETPSQKAESAYRRGVASIQEGYVNDGIVALEQALQANPRHDAARQTLVRVLIDNKRTEEAIGLMQAGLTLDPRQPSMAMLLARLQIEHGGTGIDTLMRSLPYAGNNAEYHAFLAGALQRQQRHGEAVEQYVIALRGAAQNGVWLMGLGISLQAEHRDAEALDAFRKAKNVGTLSAELLAFVDAKIQQLAR